MTSPLFSQSSISVQAIYGGRINAMSGFKTTTTDGRIFVATESANSIFSASISTPMMGAGSVGNFSVLPCANETANLGSSIQRMATHKLSESLAFIASGTLYTTVTPYSTKVSLATGVNDVMIKLGNLFYLRNSTELNWGSLSGAGAYTATGSQTYPALGSLSNAKLTIGSDDYIYAFGEGTTPSLLKSSDLHSSFTTSSTFSTISLASLSSSVTWKAFGVGPDGRLFVAGSNNMTKYIAYSDDAGATWTSVNTGLSGQSGSNLAFYQTGTMPMAYKVFFAKGYSDDKGATWQEFGNTSFQTHPNDGSVAVFPSPTLYGDFIVCMTTDQGIGASTNGGSVITEINTGIEAIQVNDFDMNDTKTDGWMASKAGVRSVSSFNTTANWSNAMFPNGDGSPYYSAEMIGNTVSSAYVGNVRVYKTTNTGTSWTQVFTAENAPYSFASSSQVKAIEVCPTDNNLVLVGYNQQGSNKGGVFYTTDGGTSWAQLRIVATSDGQDVDVNDIAFNTEGGNTVAYIAVEYNSGSPASYSIYRAVWNGTTWTVAQSMTSTETALGHDYIVSIEDIHISSSGNLLIAGGANASGQARLYYRDKIGTDLWTYLSTYVAGANNVPAVTLGVDTVFYALNNQIYAKKLTGGSAVYHTYSNGTQINFLYYDALLAGTGTGMQDVNNLSVVLPVEFMDFQAVLNDKKAAHLTWQTASSVNAKGFYVEKAESNAYTEGGKNLNFNRIGFVNDKNQAAAYDFLDADVTEGKTYYYRLKQVDMNEAFTYSKVVAVSVLGKKSDWQLYPNPSKNKTTISFYAPNDGDIWISLVDATGREVKRQSFGYLKAGSHQLTLLTTDLPNGTYICHLATATDVSVKRLIIGD
jgi:Secretion system C-terminal sorting domain